MTGTLDLKGILRAYGATVYRTLTGEWRDAAYETVLAEKLKDIDLNAHAREIIRTFVHRDVAERAKRQVIHLNKSGIWEPGLFEEESAKDAVIRLGTGARVKVYEATGPHWINHLFQQQKAQLAAALSGDRTVKFLESKVGLRLQRDVRLKTCEVMREFGHWPEPRRDPEDATQDPSAQASA